VSFRLGNVIAPAMYERFPSFIHKAEERDRILWSYIDTRDAAAACRLAIETDGLGAVALNIAADDTSMAIESRQLMAERYPQVTDFRNPCSGFTSLLSNDKAKLMLNWQPQHAWRSYVTE